MISVSTVHHIADLLGKLGHPDDAEALAAAREASRLVGDNGMSWETLLGAPLPVGAPDHQAEAERLLRVGRAVLDGFERNFLVGITGHRSLSPRQQERLAAIRTKVRLAGLLEEGN
jgi:hypothetical protein